jgi:hypothetical protein
VGAGDASSSCRQRSTQRGGRRPLRRRIESGHPRGAARPQRYSDPRHAYCPTIRDCGTAGLVRAAASWWTAPRSPAAAGGPIATCARRRAVNVLRAESEIAVPPSMRSATPVGIRGRSGGYQQARAPGKHCDPRVPRTHNLKTGPTGRSCRGMPVSSWSPLGRTSRFGGNWEGTPKASSQSSPSAAAGNAGLDDAERDGPWNPAIGTVAKRFSSTLGAELGSPVAGAPPAAASRSGPPPLVRPGRACIGGRACATPGAGPQVPRETFGRGGVQLPGCRLFSPILGRRSRTATPFSFDPTESPW